MEPEGSAGHSLVTVIDLEPVTVISRGWPEASVCTEQLLPGVLKEPSAKQECLVIDGIQVCSQKSI